MKIRNYIYAILFLASAAALANDAIRISADKCLSLAQNSKISEGEFRKALDDLKMQCRTESEKQYFEEVKLLAEVRFNKRPLVTAVTNFTCDDASLAMLVKPSMISEILETSLDDSFTKVTRKDIDKAIEELNFQNSDLFDQKTSAKLGSFVGAQYIICGNIQKTNNKFLITARVIEVATGKIVKTGILKDLQSTDEIPDAIPSLAKQLSIRDKQKNNVSLSGYVIKYLNSANKKLYSGNFSDAENDIVHSNMFVEGNTISNSLIPLQRSITASTCFRSQRNYKSSVQELDNALGIAKNIFGETDDVVIHYYYNLAKSHFQNGNMEKAEAAFHDARKLFERTKEAENGREVPFSAFGDIIKKRMNNEKYHFDKSDLENQNNNFLLKKFDIKSSVSNNLTGSTTDIVSKHQPSTALPIAKTLSPSVNVLPVSQSSNSDELKALLRTLAKQKHQKQWKEMAVTAGKIFAKDSQNIEAKEIIANLLINTDKQIQVGNYIDAAKVLTEIKSLLPPAYIRRIAVCHEKNGDIQEAEKYYAEAGSRKDLPSLMWLGRNYVKNGNPEEGIKYYEIAIANGYDRACLPLALIYLSKRYGIYDEVKGISYMKQAAEAGVPAAQYNLGCCYAKFAGTRYSSVSYNREEAIEWLEKAKRNGVKLAEKALERLK